MLFEMLLWHGPFGKASRVLLLLLLLSLQVVGVGSVCPHCYGNFASCSFDADGKCPTVTVVAENAGILAGSAAGFLTLATIVKAKFLRVFSKTSL